jgi:hypothetical protein
VAVDEDVAAEVGLALRFGRFGFGWMDFDDVDDGQLVGGHGFVPPHRVLE